MPMIDPSPNADELDQLEQSLKQAAGAVAAYLKTPEGLNDPNHHALTSAALTLLTEADDIATAELDLATQDGGQAVDVINAATDQLKAAIQARADFSKDLGLIQHVTAFAAAIASGDPKGIISAGQTLVTDLKPAGG